MAKQTYVGAGMLAPGLASVVLAQHFVLGGLWTLKGDFGSLLRKLLFLGRTLLLRLWVFGTHVRNRLGRLGEQPKQLGYAGAGMLAPGLANV